MEKRLIAVILPVLLILAAWSAAADMGTAAHTADVTLSPDVANCEDDLGEFTVNIYNEGPEYDIYNVKIYRGSAGIYDITCGDAPAGWTCYDGDGDGACDLKYGQYCEYETDPLGTDVIHPDEDLDFTFHATFNQDTGDCYTEFRVSTLDNEAILTGQGDGVELNSYVDLSVDCTPPFIEKSLDGEHLPLTSCELDSQNSEDGTCDWWITQDTTISLNVDESGERDVCNLGIDYCEWRYFYDGELVTDNEYCDGELQDDGWCRIDDSYDGFFMDWLIQFGEDSQHDIEVRCVDEADNWAELEETDKVDSTAPETEKWFNGPQEFVEGDGGTVEYIDGVSTIEMSATDGGPICAVGVDKTWYNIQLLTQTGQVGSDESDWDACYYPDDYCNADFLDADFPAEPSTEVIMDAQDECGDYEPNTDDWYDCVESYVWDAGFDESWRIYRGDEIGGIEESCHAMAYFSIDYLSNREETKYNCFFVDHTPPSVTMDVSTPRVEDADDEKDFTWVTSETEILFSCVDEGPHPSGGETLCFAVGYDNADGEGNYGDYTEHYCEKYGGTIGEDGFCCIDASTEEADLVFSFDEESEHDIRYYCHDAVEKASETEQHWFRVDNTAPTIEKSMVSGSFIGDCLPAPDSDDACYVDDTAVIGITVADPDPTEMGCNVGINPEGGCTYRIEWLVDEDECESAGYMSDGVCIVEEGLITDYREISFDEDSTHRLVVECVDRLGHETDDVEQFRVDLTPPETTKTYDDPVFPGGGMNDYARYNVPYGPQECEASCSGVAEPEHEFCMEDCSRRSIPGYARWITTATPIELSAEDEKVGGGATYVRVLTVSDQEQGEYICGHARPMDGEPEAACYPGYYGDRVTNPEAPFEEYTGPFTIPEESCHVIEYYSVDALGNEETRKWQCVFVDDTPPEQTKDVSSPSIYVGEGGDADCDLGAAGVEGGSCGDGIDWYVTQGTPIVVTCDDPRPHPVAGNQLCFKVSYEGDARNTTVSEEECAELGGEMTEDGCFLTQSYCEGVIPCEVESDMMSYDMNYNEETGECCVAEHLFVPESTLAPRAAGPVSYHLRFQEDSIHNFEFVCRDALGNAGEPDIEYFAVDTVPPVSTKYFEGPQYFEDVCNDDPGVVEDDCWTVEYIDTASTVLIDAEDPQPHPSGLDLIWYKLDVFDSVFDYCYEPKEYCNAEGLGSTKHPFRKYHCPVQGEEVGADVACPTVGDCILDAERSCEEDFERNTDDWYDCVEAAAWEECDLDESWRIYRGEPIEQEVESCHALQYFSVDNLGNVEDLRFNCFFVDKQPPRADLSFGMCAYESKDALYIGSLTDIEINAEDVQPHPSGLDKVSYRVSLVEDEYCRDAELCEEAEGSGDWTPYNGSVFGIADESCHLIEVNVSDHVEKNKVYKHCVFVDTSAPVTNKTVGEPAEPMSEEHQEQGEVFYEGLSSLCDEEGKCWDVTLLTPVHLDCTDPEPHPSGGQQVCFTVGLDGDDVTEQYCDDKDGEMGEDGFCCLPDGTDFLFNEESWHELSYYCVDNTCNKGPVDTEYFKVEGTPFHIQLFKKWNLISVPFVLIDDDPDAVFGDLENVESVWTYDGTTGEWLVWRPNGPSDLEHILPGWGYWVMMKDDEELTIGGSLFQPAKLPPSKPLTPGWNLIGTYGTQWQHYPMQKDISFVCGDEYGIKEDVFGSEVYCALNSLVDTQQGFPRWSSLWSYVNCGGHSAGWTGLNACPFDDGSLAVDQRQRPSPPYYETSSDRMYAGRGYWVEMDVADEYSPATNCIWNELNLCVQDVQSPR